MDKINAQAFQARMQEIKDASLAMVGPSLIERLIVLPPHEREAILSTLGPLDHIRILYEWRLWARPKQIPPTWDWFVWFLLGGRGSGKSRPAAEWICKKVINGSMSIALIGPTLGDIRRFMVGGHKKKSRNGSGILDVYPVFRESDRPDFKEAKGEIHFPTGAIAYLCTGEEPELRGANLDDAWCDEPIKWRYLRRLWDNLMLTLREVSANRPQVVVTSSPMPIEWIKELIMDPETATVHATTHENRSNVSAKWLATMDRRIGGTRQGAQELEAEVLGDNPDALWSMVSIDMHRVTDAPQMKRVVVSIDPAVSDNKKSDETGITVEALGNNDEGYVLEDLSGKYQPHQWGMIAVRACIKWNAVAVVERNKVGDLGKSNLMAAAIAIDKENGKGPIVQRTLKIIEKLSKGSKESRAQPISTMYEKGFCHHIGNFAALEQEMTEWNPRTTPVSPNRIDAMVQGFRELFGLEEGRSAPPGQPHGGGGDANGRGRPEPRGAMAYNYNEDDTHRGRW